MAFENVKLLTEEIKEYQVPDYRMIRPGTGTVDREKNIKLFNYWTSVDEPNELYFILVWNDSVIDIVMEREVKENSVKWKLCKMNIPKEGGLNREDVLGELRSAMRVYGFSGFTYLKPLETEVIIDF